MRYILKSSDIVRIIFANDRFVIDYFRIGANQVKYISDSGHFCRNSISLQKKRQVQIAYVLSFHYLRYGQEFRIRVTNLLIYLYALTDGTYNYQVCVFLLKDLFYYLWECQQKGKEF